jgi:hypothetical protein
MITEEQSNENIIENSFSSLMHFFKISLQHADKVIIADVYISILKYFIKTLLHKSIKAQHVVDAILDSVKFFILKINEKQLKKIFEDVLQFLKEKPDADKEGFNINLNYKISHCIISFQIINAILKGISSIFVPYFEKYKNYTIDLINFLNAIFTVEDKRKSSKKKKDRVNYDNAYEDNEKFSYMCLNSLLLENVKLNFKYNNDQLLAETIEDLFEPLAGQLKFAFFEEDKIVKYFDKEIKFCILEVFKNVKSEDLFKQFNDIVNIFM